MGLFGIIINVINSIKGISDPLIRDFTESAERNMIEISARVNKFEDAGTIYVTDKIGKWLDKKGCLELLVGTNNYQSKVIDYYNYGKDAIEKICQQARDCDYEYSQNISLCVSQAERVNLLLSELAECLDTNSPSYDSKQSVYDRLLWFDIHWLKDKNGDNCKVNTISSEMSDNHKQRMPQQIKEEDFIEFCNTEGVEDIFVDYADYIYDEIDKEGLLGVVWTATGTVIYKGIEMTVEEFLGLISKEGYMDRLTYENLSKIIFSMINESKTCENFVKDHDIAKESLEELLEKYLKNIEEKDGKNELSQEEYRFERFINYLGGIDLVKELIEKCPQLLDYLFTDYSEGLAIIEQIEITCERSGNEEMRSAVERLHQEYENKWMGILHSGLDFSTDMLKELTDKGIKEWVKDNYGDYSVINTILDVTGLETDVEAKHTLIALRKIHSDLQEAYSDAIETIRSGNYDEKDLDYLKNTFEAMKQTEISIYESYRDLCDDDQQKQIYINEQINKLNKLNIYILIRGYLMHN